MKLSVEHTAKVKTIAVMLLISSVGNEFKCLLALLRHGSASLGILENKSAVRRYFFYSFCFLLMAD